MATENNAVVLYTRQEIDAVVSGLAMEISRDYAGKKPLVIGVLKGSFVFLADLVRKLDFPLEIEFVRLASYGSAQTSSGSIKMLLGVGKPIEGRHVLVIEDIVDTGLSIAFMMEHLYADKPASVKLCALLDKSSRRQVPVTIDYCGLTVPDKFLVGYGLDCNEQYRNLPDISYIEAPE
jgi:hypoxanthine phosphoribosyltransferase